MRIRALYPAFGVMLALLLTVTGQSMAVARGASAATGEMVICIGTQTTTVYVDAEGNPTKPPHLCPDCMLGFAPTSVFDPLPFDAPQSLAIQKTLSALVLAQFDFDGFLSRAPPALA